MTARLTVLIPTRNRSAFLERALDAMLAQTRPADEIIVVDQSTDGASAEVCARLGPSVRHLPDAGAGLSRARNLGLAVATGDIIAAVDDDCYAAPDWSERLVAAFEAPDVAAVLGEMLPGPSEDGTDGITISTITFPAIRRHSSPTPPDTIGFGGNMALRRSAWDALGTRPCDERLGAGTANPGGEDMDVIYRLLRRRLVVASVPGVVVVHDQWRPASETARHMYGYGRGYGAFVAKHLFGGDRYAARLLLRHLSADLRFLASGVRRRSPARLRVGSARLRGTLRGVIQGPSLARGTRAS